MAGPPIGQHVGPFLLGCACALAAAVVLWVLCARVTARDEVRLTLVDTADVRPVAGNSDMSEAAGAGAYSMCVCPSCGTTVTQAGRVHCTNVLCPVCGSPMVRPRSVFAWRQRDNISLKKT